MSSATLRTEAESLVAELRGHGPLPADSAPACALVELVLELDFDAVIGTPTQVPQTSPNLGKRARLKEPY